MVWVWSALAVSMTVAALACKAALPLCRPAGAAPVKGTADLAALEALVWPKGMVAERPWRFIVIHHSDTTAGTLEAIDKAHRDRGFAAGIGYHFIINNGRSDGTADGQITLTPRWLQQLDGAHCKVPDHPEFNTEGIGLCIIGKCETRPPTARQMTSLELLVLALQNRYKIPLERVLDHGELKNTECPGRFFPMERLLMDLRQAYINSHLLAPRPAE